ncbi:MAG: APC family permease [Gammaproteobacteria bacterium]|nr:APC family permease [Gammaproteobacteria bacterium]
MHPSSDRVLVTNRLSFIDILGHTLANITPSAMATVTISLVAANGGLLTWAVYLAVGVLMLGVAVEVAALARRVPSAGSLFVSVGRTLHPLAGLLSGWAMLGGYLGALLAAPIVGALFFSKALGVIGLALGWPPIAVAFTVLAWVLTVRDAVIAVRYSLYVEILSLGAIVSVALFTLFRQGFIDPAQWQARLSPASFFAAMTLSVLAYGGFETAANLGREGRHAARDVPRAIIVSVLVSLVFYVFMSYSETLGFHDDPALLAQTAAPLSALAVREHLPWLALVSDMAMAVAAFSAAIATMNSLSRLLYSMARHGAVPGALGAVGTHRTPAPALHLLGFMTLAFAVTAALMHWRLLSILDLFGVFTALGFIVIYVLAVVAVIGGHVQAGQRPPVLSLLLLVTAVPLLLYVFSQSFWAAQAPTRVAAWTFVFYLSGGAALYAWQTRAGRTLGFGVARQDD